MGRYLPLPTITVLSSCWEPSCLSCIYFCCGICRAGVSIFTCSLLSSACAVFSVYWEHSSFWMALRLAQEWAFPLQSTARRKTAESPAPQRYCRWQPIAAQAVTSAKTALLAKTAPLAKTASSAKTAPTTPPCSSHVAVMLQSLTWLDGCEMDFWEVKLFFNVYDIFLLSPRDSASSLIP